MDTAHLRELVRDLNVWKRGDQRAPHKPLLLLYALGRIRNGEPRLVSYEEVDGDLGRLLEEFGPRRRSQHPEYPFWRLVNDGLWSLEGPGSERILETPRDPSRGYLIEQGISGGFRPEIQRLLEERPTLVGELARQILDQEFPPTYHDDILLAVGLDTDIEGPTEEVERRVRDPRFRIKVITAYEYRCGLCGFNVRLANTPIGLEAAHIKWHTHGGPDTETNGIALCSLHHKLFDRGAFTVSQEREVQVSEHVNGSEGLEEWLLDFHARPLRPPQRSDYAPEPRFLDWHAREVFHGPARARPG